MPTTNVATNSGDSSMQINTRFGAQSTDVDHQFPHGLAG